MSLTTTSLSDSLPSSIPKIDSTGLNWAIFSLRFRTLSKRKAFGAILTVLSLVPGPRWPQHPRQRLLKVVGQLLPQLQRYPLRIWQPSFNGTRTRDRLNFYLPIRFPTPLSCAFTLRRPLRNVGMRSLWSVRRRERMRKPSCARNPWR